jgi:transcriptional regulator with GAF, ATPase, and Fis domain
MAEQATLQTRMANSHSQEWSTAKGRTAAIINKVHAAKNLDELFFELKSELATLFEVEQLTLYAVDREKRELYSKYLLDPLDGVQEIRVPINEASVSGYCARYGKIVNIADAYDAAELAAISPRLCFDPSWDKRSGFRSRQMLAVPILVERKYLMGVLLLINKRSGERFTVE